MPTVLLLQGYRFFFAAARTTSHRISMLSMAISLRSIGLSRWNWHHPNGFATMSWALSAPWWKPIVVRF